MNISQVNTAIISGNWSNADLESMIDAVKYVRSRITQKAICSLRVGNNVNFTSSRTGRNVTGLVTKVAQKYVTVKTVEGLWRVPANMLTVIED